MKKIMIIYCKYGDGHFSAAKNIEEHIQTDFPNCEIFMFDFMDYLNKFTDKIGKKLYAQITGNIPWLWGKIYYNTQNTFSQKNINTINSLLSIKLKKIIISFNPDIIISTHFFANHMCAILKAKKIISAKLATIITDYGEHPYKEWINKHEFIDYIFVPHDDMKRVLITERNFCK